MYTAVNDNLNPPSISDTAGATVTSLPTWALVGAELQDPKTGEIIAEYPGKGQNLSANACDGACEVNTASQAREQVGSSFKPYVLSTAVHAGHERPEQHPGHEPVRVHRAGPVVHVLGAILDGVRCTAADAAQNELRAPRARIRSRTTAAS